MTGSVVNFAVNTSFIPPGGTTTTAFTNYIVPVSGVAASASASVFNYYNVSFPLSSDTIAADDLAAICVTRTGAADTFNADIYLTSIEFRYQQ